MEFSTARALETDAVPAISYHWHSAHLLAAAANQWPFVQGPRERPPRPAHCNRHRTNDELRPNQPMPIRDWATTDGAAEIKVNKLKRLTTPRHARLRRQQSHVSLLAAPFFKVGGHWPVGSEEMLGGHTTSHRTDRFPRFLLDRCSGRCVKIPRVETRFGWYHSMFMPLCQAGYSRLQCPSSSTPSLLARSSHPYYVAKIKQRESARKRESVKELHPPPPTNQNPNLSPI